MGGGEEGPTVPFEQLAALDRLVVRHWLAVHFPPGRAAVGGGGGGGGEDEGGDEGVGGGGSEAVQRAAKMRRLLVAGDLR